MSLTDLQLRKFKPESKTYRKSDGGGLFIEVRPNGSKLWRLPYRFNGKQKLMALGSYPETSLATAREKRLEARSLLQSDIDPLEKLKADRAEQEALNEHIFQNIAEELLEKNRREQKAETTLKKKAWLLDMANAGFGEVPINQLKAPAILKVLKKVEAKGQYETAKRLRTVIGQVCRYAIATGRADMDPTYGLRGALVAPRVKHMAAMTEKDDFMQLVRAVWRYEGSGPVIQSAIRLMVLLYPRPGELRLSGWKEFDLERGIWTIPGERTKMRRVHIKPLAPLVIEILADLKAFSNDSQYVFPSLHAMGKPISENTMNQALRRMAYSKDEATSHGFRASASSLLNECGLWSPDAIEAELGHVGTNQVRRAYHRTRYWKERVEMAQWWADEIETALGG